MALSVGDLLVNIKSDTTQLISGFNKAEAAVNKTTKQMSYAVKGLIGAFVGLNTLDIAKNFTTQLDLITSANNKLKLVTKTTEEYTIAQKRLFEVAQITSAGYSETVTLYSKLSDSMGKMGKSQSDIIRTVETVNKTIALSGSTASEASAAILQLGQAFGSGRLQGDELKSISENAQGLALAIAEGMGVAVGELKQLGSEGKITSEILATALEKVANSTDEKYGKMSKTIAQSMQIVQNSIGQVIAQFDKMTGVSNVIADNIQGISKALDAINSDDLESMFNTFKLGTELIVGTYVALKLLRGGQEAYNFVSNATAEISKRNTDIEIAKNKAYNDGITAAYARKAADEAMANAQKNTANISERNIEIEKAKAQAYSDGTRAVMARKLADEAMANAQSSGLVMLEKHAKELDIEATQLEKVAKKQLEYSYAIEAKSVKPSDMKYARQLEAEAIQLEKVAKKQLEHSYSLEATASKYSLATIGANAFKMAMSTIPFIAITTGIGLIAEALFSAKKESDIFRESLQKTADELQKLTTSQRQYLINISIENIKKAEDELKTLKSYLDNVGVDVGMTIVTDEDLRKQDELKTRLQANVDTKQEEVDKYKTQLDVLENINKKEKETASQKKTVEIKVNTIFPEGEKSIIENLIGEDTTFTKEVNLKFKNIEKLPELTDELKKILTPKDVIIEDYAKKFADLTASGKTTPENVAKLQKLMYEEIDNLDKEAVQKRKDAEREKEKAAKEAQEKIKDLTKEATELTISDVDKINAKYLEMYNVIKDTFNQEQMKAFNTSWQEAVEKANGTLDAQKAKQDLVNQALATATSEVDTINNKYMEMYEAIKDNPLFDDAKMTELYKKWQDELDKTKEKLDFNTTIELDIIGDDKSIQRIEKSFQDLNKATKHYEENRAKIKKGSEEEAKNEEMFRKDQMNGYINMAGALGSMFEQGSKEAATFQAAQLSLALVEGTRAILTAGTGDPYTAIPRMAAMGIMVKSLLGNIGVAFGMNSSSTSGDSFSMQTANTGMGSTLGDSKKASESISNALKTLEDFAEPQYEVLNSMNSYLKTIANNISGVSSILVRNAGTALGQNYTGGYDTGFKNNVSSNLLINSVVNPLNSIISKIPVVGQINNLIGGAFNSVLGGLFGKTSVSVKLTDSGITFADAYLKDAVEQLNGSVYQTIKKTTTEKSWFGSSSSSSIKTYFSELDNQVSSQFSLVLSGLYNTVEESGKALGISSTELENKLDNFVVSIGKISLKDKTGTQIQELLTNVFAKVADDITTEMFNIYETVEEQRPIYKKSKLGEWEGLTRQPKSYLVGYETVTVQKVVGNTLIGFQKAGEGLFDTMIRVATGIQEASFYSDRLGLSITKYTDIINQQGTVGFEALAQSIIKADEATYGLNNGVVQMIGSMNLTASELYSTYLSFSNIRDILVATSQSASNLSSSMVTGAGSISLLESGTNSYMENFLSDNERLNVELSRLNKQFSLAGYAMPKTRQEFINLINSIDTSTEAGAKSYGKLITISDSYNKTISEIEDNLSSLINTFSTLGDSVAQTIATLAGADSDSLSATASIKSFWEKRKEIDDLLALNGNLTEAQQSRLSTLVGEVNSLATNIQGLDTSSSSITSELISNLTSLESALNLEEQILSVNIVGVAPNVALIENIAGITATVPTLTNNTSNYVTSSELSTEIKDILTTIKDNISTYPKRTLDILDGVINGNQRVKVQN